MNKPEKLILDYSKWRCGGEGYRNRLGHGITSLLNEEGYSCCIGQWCKQEGATDPDILNVKSPMSMVVDIPLFLINANWKNNNTLAYDCMEINDCPDTTPEEKIEKLTKRLAQEGLQLEVINKP